VGVNGCLNRVEEVAGADHRSFPLGRQPETHSTIHPHGQMPVAWPVSQPRSWAGLRAHHEPERQAQTGGNGLLDNVKAEVFVEADIAFGLCLQVDGHPVPVCPPHACSYQCRAEAHALMFRVNANRLQIPVRTGHVLFPALIPLTEHGHQAAAIARRQRHHKPRHSHA